MPTYRVKTEVTATVEETWIVDSHEPLTKGQIEDGITGGAFPAGVKFRHASDMITGEETERTVVKVATI